MDRPAFALPVAAFLLLDPVFRPATWLLLDGCACVCFCVCGGCGSAEVDCVPPIISHTLVSPLYIIYSIVDLVGGEQY